ncbi:thioredoxin domain-containing protein [Autumnicola musiva]|uniref:Thioredoxin domain-containing protein n=1 Tax=Autumnicola musiva TaxID=3075589 RepID=A0ABU3D0H1_9FLAO|nr:thioredoxin domain-containing protein [Zunongwangia sp. F117]MDT0675040.1 thioredoxin domain-containing protein [Zunongwangia sp. F117]
MLPEKQELFYPENMTTQKPKYTNKLIEESSPYLLQHAHNPVNWHAWNDDSIAEAKDENKLLLISVGYSACHWCHVMEHESFEDESVAKIMNIHYVNIKVDREERPDIDQVYMNAVQLMTGSGGWPMNIVALPDGRPVWGGTYFRKEQWKDALLQISRLYKEKPEQLFEYAEKLNEGLQQLQLIKVPEDTANFNREFLQELLANWHKNMDLEHGGPKGAPKFMMPNSMQFLMRYAWQQEDQELLDYVQLSLKKMSYGGIYDHIGGGFSRYSVDEKWHIPHFEKMLYDNAQLITLYSQAYALTGYDWYEVVVHQTLHFVEKELTDRSGAFYSALDADSPDENGHPKEGAYYAWTKEELQSLIGDEFPLFAELYNINDFGRWEEDKYVLIRNMETKEVAQNLNISEEQLLEKHGDWQKILNDERQKRAKPGLDDKSLTSWNALMLSAYAEAYKVFKNPAYQEAAVNNAQFIIENQLTKDGRLFHTYKNGKSSINGYLEDYAFTIEAFLNLYEITTEEKWLQLCDELAEYCFRNFYDKNTGFFFFTSEKDRPLVTRNIEYTDNVIPASNSAMAKNLFILHRHFSKEKYRSTAENMLKGVQDQMKKYPRGYSNWLDLMMNYTHPFYEVVITGEQARDLSSEFGNFYLPNILLTGSEKPGKSALLKDRFKAGKNLIYICSEGKCELPLTSVKDSLNLIKRS